MEFLEGYEPFTRIGEGTMGVVYKAQDLKLERTVAIKVIVFRATFGEDRQEFFTRLSRHVRLAAKLVHPNIVATYNFLTHHDRAYLVMEYVDGETMDVSLGKFGLQSPAAALGIIRPVALALDYAHAQGVLHRDLKPANILIGNHGAVKVADFELKGAIETRRSDHFGALGGTPPHLAPETIFEHSPRSDQFSLAVCAFQMLSGRRPPGDDLASALDQIREGRFSDISATNPALGPAVQLVLARGLARKPADRFASCVEFASILEQACTMTLFGPPEPPQASSPAATRPIAPEEAPVQPIDNDVQFTVYRSSSVPPLQWRPLLAFAHRSQRTPDEPDPVAEVKRQAKALLGEQFAQYDELRQDSSQSVQHGDEITFVPQVDGVEFDPPRRSFKWRRSVHREEFQLRAEQRLVGQVARGRLSVYLGNIIVAQVTLQIKVDAQAPALARRLMFKETARIYCNIFVSYSHRDTQVVQEFQRYAAARGDRYLMDVANLKPGEPWGEGLRKLIDEADVFQLFWSRNSMKSEVVREEYEYALSLPRERFVCPVYWEDPMPEESERGLPPEELRQLHFQRIYPASVTPPAPARPFEHTQSFSTGAGAPAARPAPPPAGAAAPPPTPASMAPRSVGPRFGLGLVFGLCVVIALGILLYYFLARR
jgi:serine/threonine protein kinase